jgi:hypothetical protein
MSIRIHRPAPVAHHPAALAAALAALLTTGAAAGIAWQANEPVSRAPTHVVNYQPHATRMLHGFVESQAR